MTMTGTIGKAVKTPENKALLRDIQTQLGHMQRSLLSRTCPEPMRSDLRRVITSGGKRLRPTLALLCHRIGGAKKYPVRPLMDMLELMHTASLIHDDVVDGAAARRGAATINATSGVGAAVRSGDLLLAEAMENLRFYKGSGINEALAAASEEMCLGELLGLGTRFAPIPRKQYFIQIHRKTASLIAASCYSGAVAGGLPEAEAKALETYGENLGVAFQLGDDLLDFSRSRESGKEPGQDLRNGIFTLPALYLLESGIPASVKNLLMKRDRDNGEIGRLIDYVRNSGALDYTKTVIRRKTDDAVGALGDLPESREKTALIELALGLADRHV